MVVGLGIGLLKYHDLKENPETALALLPEAAEVTLNHIHHVATRNGVQEWILDAESVRYEKPNNKAILKGVSATFFLRDGNTVRLTSTDGLFLTNTKNMEASGDVVVRSGSHALKTQKLCYDYENRSISTDTPITLEGDGIRLTGESMVFSFKSEQAVISGGVEAVFENRML
jgi:LPS export ABC transporter protein LptC